MCVLAVDNVSAAFLLLGCLMTCLVSAFVMGMLSGFVSYKSCMTSSQDSYE